MNKMKKNQINDGHYLELMDRLYIQTSSIENYLMTHPLTKKNKKVRKLIDKAGMSLAEAYQIVGHESYLNEDKKNAIQKVILRRRKKSSN
jgi:hypothetical protein